MFGKDKNKKREKKIGILNTPLAVVILEMHWGIAGRISQTTVALV